MMILIVSMYNNIQVQQLITIKIKLYTYLLSVLRGSLTIKFKKISLKGMIDQGNVVKNP